MHNHANATLIIGLLVLFHISSTCAFCSGPSSACYEHSSPQLFTYAARTLRWFIHEHGNRKHTHDRFDGIRHRVPLLLEQYYRHLAIATTDTPNPLVPALYYHTLNFPGMITLTDDTHLKRGVFSISFSPHDDVIFHRYFHYARQKNILNKELRKHRHMLKRLGGAMLSNFTQINFDDDDPDETDGTDTCDTTICSKSLDDSRETDSSAVHDIEPESYDDSSEDDFSEAHDTTPCAEPHTATSYTVWENPYLVEITDQFNITYTIFKTHTLQKLAINSSE